MTTQCDGMIHRVYILLIGDIVLAVFSQLAAHYLRFGSQDGRNLFSEHGLQVTIIVIIFLLSSYIFEAYSLGRHWNRGALAGNSIMAGLFSFVSLSILYFLLPSLEMGRGLLAIDLGLFVLLQFCWHTLFASYFSHFLATDNIVIIGTGDAAATIGALVQSPPYQFSHKFLGYVEDKSDTISPVVIDSQICCDLVDLTKCINTLDVTHIVVAELKHGDRKLLHSELLNCKMKGILIQDAQTFYEAQTGKLLLEYMDMNWLIFSNGFRRRRQVFFIKRMIDLLLAAIVFILTVPFFPLIALLVKLNAPGPIFYNQLRTGELGRPFRLYKFRTMKEDAECDSGAVWSQECDPRIPLIGRLLRKFRIDELPQIYNVFKGELSFIGPRPERPEFVKELKKQLPLYDKRHFIKPGLTGWAQISYPYGSSVEDSYEKLRYDLYYFKNMSPIFDIIIFLKTFKVILMGSGGR